MNLMNVILMAGQTQSDQKGGGYSMLIMLALIFVVFYFFMIRPQTKKAKEQKKFRESLKKGDKIVTIGGIHGKIVEVRETTVIVETEGQNKLKLEKSAIASEFSNQMSEKK
ncbi:MAG: preprotein translocase subunit YajC [Bacteroidales bacterium]|nr:preprotein translocase subunit YajC [Bacteroidales bacterium]